MECTLQSLVLLACHKSVNSDAIVSINRNAVTIKGIGSIHSMEAKAFLLTLLTLAEYHTLCNYIGMLCILCIPLNGDVSLDYINAELDRRKLPHDILYTFGDRQLRLGSGVPNLTYKSPKFSLRSAAKLACSIDISSNVSMALTFSSVYVFEFGYLNMDRGRNAIVELLGWRGYLRLKHWLGLCRALGIKLEGDITQKYINSELAKLGLEPYVLHILVLYKSNFRAVAPE